MEPRSGSTVISFVSLSRQALAMCRRIARVLGLGWFMVSSPLVRSSRSIRGLYHGNQMSCGVSEQVTSRRGRVWYLAYENLLRTRY